jgi:hypothetical protein
MHQALCKTFTDKTYTSSNNNSNIINTNTILTNSKSRIVLVGVVQLRFHQTMKMTEAKAWS